MKRLLLPSSSQIVTTGLSYSAISRRGVVVGNKVQKKYITFRGRRRMQAIEAEQWGIRSKLAVVDSQVASEWDYEKNPMSKYPAIIPASAIEPFWWKCSKCEHSYQMAPERRVLRGIGCPSCGAHGFSPKQSASAQEVVVANDDYPTTGFLRGESSSAFRRKAGLRTNIKDPRIAGQSPFPGGQ